MDRGPSAWNDIPQQLSSRGVNCMDEEKDQLNCYKYISKIPPAVRTDSQRVKHLEEKLETMIRVNELRVEELRLLHAEKREGEKALEDERTYFSDHCAELSVQHTARIEALQKNWMTLLMDCQGPEKLDLAATTRSKFEKSLDGMRVQLKLRSAERDKWKSNCKTLEEAAVVCKVELKRVTQELAKSKAETIKQVNAASEGTSKNLEELCRDLLEQLEQRNVDLQKHKKDQQETAQRQSLLQQEINLHKEENKRLKRQIMGEKRLKNNEATECIICLDEFGAEPDRQRAHWTDCNHANICYKCTSTLWNTKKRKCPSCNTPASTMPGRLPPNVYL